MKKTKLESDLFYYEDYLKLISKFSLSKQLTLKDLGETPEDKAVIQKCYRDIKREGFAGNVINYLCHISYLSIEEIYNKEAIEAAVDAKQDKDGNIIVTSAILEPDSILSIAKKHVSNCRINITKKKQKISDFFIDGDAVFAEKMIAFLLVCYENEIHSRNMIRLFQRNPWLIIETEYNFSINLPTIDFTMQTLNYFTLVMCLNCYEMLKERLVKKEKRKNLWEYMFPRFVEMIISKMYHSVHDKEMEKLIKGIEFWKSE